MPCSSVSIVNFEQVNAGWGEIELIILRLGKEIGYENENLPIKKAELEIIVS